MLSRVNCCRGLAAIAILLCGILLAYDNDPNVQICGFAGTCNEVRSSEYGKWFEIPLPYWGFAAFGVMLVLTLVDSKFISRSRQVASAAIIVSSVYFLIVQFFILKQVCDFCLAIDLVGIILGLLSFRFTLNSDLNSNSYVRLFWIPAVVALFVVPTFISVLLADHMPPSPVIAVWIQGKINVVEVTDFDCEYCQKTEPILELIKNTPDVNFVRIVAPMPKHANARIAGRAYLAATEQGKGELMAAELFKLKDRSRASCAKIAMSLGLDLEKFERWMQDPQLDRQFDGTVAWARESGTGLPMIWVNTEFFAGTPDQSKFQSAIDSARKKLPRK